MLNKTHNSFLIYMVVAAALILFSCTSKHAEIGKWQQVGQQGFIEFRDDSTFVIVDNMGSTSKGKYSITDGGIISYEITDTDILQKSIKPVLFSTVDSATMFIKGDSLELVFNTPEGNEIERYSRIK